MSYSTSLICVIIIFYFFLILTEDDGTVLEPAERCEL